MRRLTSEEFIQKVLEVHGNKYDYSKIKYINSHIKLTIKCSIHGEFDQTPSNHLQGIGCLKCKNDTIGNMFRSDINKFIQKAREVHGNKYDYSKVNYNHSQNKVTIICPDHGEFKQRPSHHLYGQGCPICKAEKTSIRLMSNLEQFIEKARLVHGNKYDYSNVEYKSSNDKIIIICSKHGRFKQRISDHLQRSGCPSCKKSKGEIAITEILEKNNIVFIDEYKIPEVVADYRYDFYLPEYNLLIEFHGIQHYEYRPHFHRKGEDEFLANKNVDDVKKDNAYRFKYRFLEFNYKQLKELTKEHFEELVMNKINRIKR